MSLDLILPLVFLSWLILANWIAKRADKPSARLSPSDILSAVVVGVGALLVASLIPSLNWIPGLAFSLSASLSLLLTGELLIPQLATFLPLLFLISTIWPRWWLLSVLVGLAVIGPALLLASSLSLDQAIPILVSLATLDLALVFSGTSPQLATELSSIPIALITPAWPSPGWVGLGAGDLLVSAWLLYLSQGRIDSRITILALSLGVWIAELTALNFSRPIPALPFLVASWLVALIYFNRHRAFSLIFGRPKTHDAAPALPE